MYAGGFHLALFIGAEAVIYLTFIILDLTDCLPGMSDIIKYSGIILCVGNSLVFCIKHRGSERFLITGALFFTACADVFLLFTGQFLWGLFFFCITQTLYSVYTVSAKKQLRVLLIPIILSTAVICVFSRNAYVNNGTGTLLLVAFVIYYAFTFALNTCRSWKNHKARPSKAGLLFAIGLSLFVMCDLNVLFRNAYEMFGWQSSLPEWTHSVAMFFTWVFYLPAQVLISICENLPFLSLPAVKKQTKV